MTVLCAETIRDLLNKRELVISPILSKVQIQEVSVDLRMGTTAHVVRSSGLSHVDPRDYLLQESSGHEHNREQGRRQKLERHEVPFGEPLVLHPGTLALVPTIEWVKLPHDLKGLVTARSSWAREGLSIATATFISPNYIGIITLELSNLGRVPIAIYPGSRIAQIAFHRVGKSENSIGPKKAGQFHMSFEPSIGKITKDDEPFIPKRVRAADSTQT